MHTSVFAKWTTSIFQRYGMTRASTTTTRGGWRAGRLYGMRGGALEILISPVTGSPSSRIRKIAHDADSPKRNRQNYEYGRIEGREQTVAKSGVNQTGTDQIHPW
jgi:hypothetical protein